MARVRVKAEARARAKVREGEVDEAQVVEERARAGVKAKGAAAWAGSVADPAVSVCARNAGKQCLTRVGHRVLR